jgi:hypothetical protein
MTLSARTRLFGALVLGLSTAALAVGTFDAVATVAAAVCTDGAVPSPFFSPSSDLLHVDAPPELLAPPEGFVELTPTETATAAATVGPTQIPVWVHVITEGAGTGVSDIEIAEQLRIMNDAFAGGQGGAPSPFSFTHAGTDRTENPDWFGAEFAAGSDNEREAKAALRKGDAKTLNMYVTETATGSSWGTFPWSYKWNPSYDGIVVAHGHFFADTPIYVDPTAIQDSWVSPQLGDVAVHEVDHWLGLYHTFHGWTETKGTGGCDGDGDVVDDTPAHDGPTGGCPTDDPDTCVSAGVDPIHNFMNYSSDRCKTEFTLGQVERTKANWATYRLAADSKTKPGRGVGRK